MVDWHEVEHVCKTPPCWPRSCTSTTGIRVGPANAPCAHSSPTSTTRADPNTQQCWVAQGGMEPHVHVPMCQQPPAPCPAPHRGLPGFSGDVFPPTPASQHAGSHKGRTCRLSDRSSLSWHCCWRQRGRSTVVLGTGKCRRWGGGSLQPGFLSCTATTSQIKVSPGGAAAAPGALGRAKRGPGTRVAGWQPACAGVGCSRCSPPSCSACAACCQPLSR